MEGEFASKLSSSVGEPMTPAIAASSSSSLLLPPLVLAVALAAEGEEEFDESA